VFPAAPGGVSSPALSVCSELIGDGAVESEPVASEIVSVVLSVVSPESGPVLDEVVSDPVGSPVESLSLDPVDPDVEPLSADDSPVLLDAEPEVELAEPAELVALDELDDDPESDDEPVVSAAATP
jgi:hypothetical protein